MTSQRNFLIIALLFVSFLLWQAWQEDHAPKPVTPQQNNQLSIADGEGNYIDAPTITIKTDVLSLTVSTYGGDVTSAKLLEYPQTLHSETPFPLLIDQENFIYIAESGLAGRNGPDRDRSAEGKESTRPTYSAAQSEFVLGDNQDEITVPLTYQENGVTYVKNFTLKRGSYNVEVSYDIKNPTNTPLEMNMYGKLVQSYELPQDISTEGGGGLGLSTYRGAAYSSQDTNYTKYSFKDIKTDTDSQQLKVTTNVGWVAMLQHYFASAWIPTQNQENTLFTKSYANKTQVAIGYIGPKVTVEPNSTVSLSSHLWVGPEIQDQLAAAADHLNLIVDYGWLWFLSQPLFHLLKFIQSFVGNWGVAIIIITFIIRGILFPLTRAQYRSLAKMKLLQPRLQALKERYGDDKQKMSQETMALYRQEKVNPLGGCLPIIIQMPIFLSLFYMLSSSVELRQAPFVLWIQDLAAPDPYFILPILMGLTMFLIQKMSPTPVTDPLQQKLMTYMPLIFTVFFLWFPSGLVLYYTVSNLFTLVQQRVIYWELEKKGLHERKKK